MSRKRYSPKQIINILREDEVLISRGRRTGEVCRGLGISEQSYYRWRQEYGGLRVDQAKRLKELEKESSRLRTAVSDLTLDKLILKEVLEGFSVPSDIKAPSGTGHPVSVTAPD